MNADQNITRQRRKGQKASNEDKMIKVETLAQRTSYDKYKLLKDDDFDQDDSEDDEVLTHNGTVQSKKDSSIGIAPDDNNEDSDTGDDSIRLIGTNGHVFVSHLPESGDESLCSIAMQILFPFLVAGLGMVGAGLVLDVVQHWEVFEVVNEIFILVPALLGLKGNLEMTLASRLSTQVGNYLFPL